METKSYIKLGVNAIKLTDEIIKNLIISGIIEHQEDGYYFISKIYNPLNGELTNIFKEKFSINDYAVLDKNIDNYYNVARIYSTQEFESVYKSIEEITFK